MPRTIFVAAVARPRAIRCYSLAMTYARAGNLFRWLVAALLALGQLTLGGCASAPAPRHSQSICDVFDQYPGWRRDALAAQKRWGTPVNVLMAFVQRESDFQAKARPDRPWFLFVPLPRRSSAYGYAQAQDPVWKEYRQANSGWFKSRKNMNNSLDFLGWYTDRIHRELGISKWDPRQLYLAYHEGIGGYRTGQWKHDSHLLQTADDVDRLAREYGAQLQQCR
jgi:hypothetical protein